MRRLLAAVGTATLLMGVLAPSTIAQPSQPIQATSEGAAALSAGQLSLQLITGSLSSPVGVVNAGDGTNRLFVIEQRGTVRVVQDRRLLPGFFLDIRTVSTGFTNGGERGLLGLAFHPSFETNEKLFVYYTRGDGDLVVAEMTANAARTSANVNTVDALLVIEHSSQGNHNGGQLLFGADGNLYAFTGDGGGGGDPDENGQDINSLLGKTLRVRPDLNGSYTTPATNPYVGEAGSDLIWAIGLRNPWRASFDRANGNLWIADVGQGSWEEVNRSVGNPGGRNYGWDCMEGKHTFEGGCSGLTLTGPVVEYGHTGGRCSVTGGYVYRGDIYQDMAGLYLLGDYCSGEIWTLPSGAGSPALTRQRDTGILISSFGEAENGELYLTSHGDGRLYKVVAPEFRDIGSSAFIDEITWIGYEGISTGCTSPTLFCPRNVVLREQMASFLVRALNLAPSGTDFFTDDNGTFHEDDINALAAAGITTGCAPTRYCPKDPVRRDAMAAFLSRGFSLPATPTDFFTDDEGNFHEADINRVAAAGISLGCGGTQFCPDRHVTREQMAGFLYRALN